MATTAHIQAVFFDVGATLLTPKEDEGRVFARIAGELGLILVPEQVTALVPQMYALYEQLYEQDDSFWSDDARAQAIWTEMYEYLASLLGVPHEAHRPLARAVYKHYFAPGAWKTFDDVMPLLNELSAQGMRLGLISNWDSTLIPVIKGMGLDRYFETIISSADVKLHKPMPEIFELALARLAVRPENALHVGDHVIADARGAAAAGLTPVLLDRNNRYVSYEGNRISSLLQLTTLL